MIKKGFLFLGMFILLITLSACTKDINGDYSAFDKQVGQVDMEINEKSVSMNFATMTKAADEASKGFFSPNIDKSMFELKGTIDTDNKVMNLKSTDGAKVKVTYEVKGDKIILNVKEFKKDIEFYNVKSDEYTKKSNDFNEQSVMEQINF